MRRKPLFLLAFLLMLYIAPMIFISSYSHVTIPTEQNMTKDFSLSIEYSEDLYLATDGEGTPTPTGDYTDTHVKDESSMFTLDASSPYDVEIILEFALPLLNIESVYLRFYGYTFTGDLSATTKELLMYNGTHWNDFGDIAEDSFGWTNITLDSNYVLSPFNTVYMKAHVVDDSMPTLLIDYAEIQFSYTDADWYNESWRYRKSISINGSVGAETNYQMRIPVTYDSDMQNDFDDIIFTAADGITLLDHWRETYAASTSAVFWVEVLDDLDNDQDIYMYYGNGAVSTTSNGANTFEFYEDWATETMNLSRWDIIDSAGTVTYDDTDANHGSVLKLEGNSGSNVYRFASDLSWGNGYALRLRGEFEETSVSSQYVFAGWKDPDLTGRLVIKSYEGTNEFQGTDDDGNNDEDSCTAYLDAYHVFDIQRTGTEGKFVVDGTLRSTVSLDPDEIAKNITFYCRDSEKDIYNDWTLVRKFVVSEPYVDSWGEKESLPPPEWNKAGEAELIFSIPIDETGLNMLLIFLGLIMIPASTLYLVKGGRSEMSSDKLFYGLIAFVLGWALFLGGIM